MAGPIGEPRDPLPDSAPYRQKRSVWPWIITLATVSFAIGLLASPWLEKTVRSRLPLPVNTDAPVPASVRNPPPAVTSGRLAQAAPAASPQDDAARLAALAAQERRIDSFERRFDGLDSRTSTALANASRAEGMLLTLAARRALDTGQPLGVIEGMLRERFGGSQPQAVAALVVVGQKPVTLGQLQSSLQTLEPQLQRASTGGGWWDELRSGIAGLILIKRENEPADEPSEQLRDARQRLMMGDVGGALWQVNRLPSDARAKAGGWAAAARRYLIARQALDTLETVALLAPPPGQAEQVIPLPAGDGPAPPSAPPG